MNRLAVSISIMAVMTVGCTAYALATDHLAADMIRLVDATEQAFTRGDSKASIAAANELDRIWDETLHYCILISDLGHSAEISSSIAEINAFAEAGSDELYAACDRAQAQIGIFRDMQIPTLWKIL